jgi:hypothetical protein
MSIKRFVADADTTITNAYDVSLINRAFYANMGAADSLEVYSIFGQASIDSIEKSRILVKFPINEISASRASGTLPASGSVNFYLKLSNVKHPFSLPSNYDLSIKPVSASWDEGTGLDMEDYRDIGISGSSGAGCNWLYRQLDTQWSASGGDFLNDYAIKYSIINGEEDILADITSIVESQIANTIPNYGLGIMLSGGFEVSTGSVSYYTKKFSARNSQFFYKRPAIEARWEDAIKDDRGDFYGSSSLLSDAENKQNIYFYNVFKGNYRNIPTSPTLTVKFYTDSTKTAEVSPSYLSMSNPEAGVYKAVTALETTASSLLDYWVNSSATGTVYFSSSFDVKTAAGTEYNTDDSYVFKITNLKETYRNNETPKLKLFSRKINWNPTIYSVAANQVENEIHKNLYYKIFRYRDNYTIIDYSTGSLAYSKVSYDSSGNYIKLDMSIFEPDYTYGIRFALYENNRIKESAEEFKFRIEAA